MRISFLRNYIGLWMLVSPLTQAGTLGDDNLSPIYDNGFYIAGNIGLENLFDNESHTLYPEKHELGSLGILGGGFIGYDYAFGAQTTLALEFFADAIGAQTSIGHTPSRYTMNQQYDIGLRLLPKYRFNEDATAHLILGYVNGHFSIADNGVYGIMSSNFNNSGFQTGFGLTTTLTTHLMTRLDMIYNLYASNTSVGNYITPPARQTYQNQFNTLVGQFSAVIKF